MAALSIQQKAGQASFSGLYAIAQAHEAPLSASSGSVGEAKRTSGRGGASHDAEKLLVIHKPLTELQGLCIQLLCAEKEVSSWLWGSALLRRAKCYYCHYPPSALTEDWCVSEAWLILTEITPRLFLYSFSNETG